MFVCLFVCFSSSKQGTLWEDTKVLSPVCPSVLLSISPSADNSTVVSKLFTRFRSHLNMHEDMGMHSLQGGGGLLSEGVLPSNGITFEWFRPKEPGLTSEGRLDC